MEKYTVVKVFLDECNAHPEWNKSEISQTLLDAIENLIDNATRFEKGLDKACELLADEYNEITEVDPEHDGSDGCTIILRNVHKTAEQWKEWCVG